MIRLARNLSLPRDAQTQTFAILAIRGVGKTYTCLKMAEGLHDQGMQFVFVDPTGVAWGLRSSADGKKPGLPVLIFGGERGDITIDKHSGQIVADFVVDERVSCVIDLSDLRKGESVQFMTEFAERLYHRKNRRRDALHIFLDEADAFAPQRPQPNQARMLGAVEDLVRRGRSRGIGLTLATQRSAVLNKDVLTQCETLIAMCNVAPQDRKAVDEWLKHAGDEEKRQEINDNLAKLDKGEAFVYSPRWLKVLKRIKVSKRDTYDSSSTPSPGTKAKQPKTRADVDLEAVRARMAATIERAQADDPKTLRKTIIGLRKEVDDLTRKLSQAEERVLHDASSESTAVSAAVAAAISLRDREWTAKLKAVAEPPPIEIETVLDGPKTKRSRSQVGVPARGLPAVGAVHVSAQEPEAPSTYRTSTHPGTPRAHAGIPPARQRILDALRFLEGIGIKPADRNQLALFADSSPKSSGYANNLGGMRTAGLIDYPSGGTVALTDLGRDVSNQTYDITTNADLHAALERKLPPAKWRIVEALISAYPEELARDVLAARIHVSPASSGFANNLGSLRTLGLIDYPSRGSVSASPILFIT